MKDKIITLIECIFAALLGIFIARFVLLFAYIPSESMENTLHKKDLLIGTRIAYEFSEPKRGDIIIFQAPFEDEKYIKRVIGLPGETLTFKEGSVYINGIRFEEDYVKEPWTTKGMKIKKFVVPENCYFVMGDNRNDSFDSRFWWQEAMEDGYAQSKEEAESYSFVNKDAIVGKALFKFYKGFDLF